jgi:hypothetical protein
MRQTLAVRVAANALELARHGVPKPPFYMAGQVAGQAFSLHAEGERVILTRAGQARQEVELVPPDQPVDGQALPILEPSPVAIELPQAVCPDGSPQSSEGMEDPLPPGVSVLDELAADDSNDSVAADIVTAEVVDVGDKEVRHD